jgi:hypothetical protein
MQQRCMAAKQARVAPGKKGTSEISNRWAIRQSCTSEMKGGDIDLKLPPFRSVARSLIPRKDKDSRRACEAGAFRDEFLSGVQAGEESLKNIFRVVHMDQSKEVQDLRLPSYQVRPSSVFTLKMRPQSFQARPFGLPLANSLATKTQRRSIDVPNACIYVSPNTTPRRELPRLPLSYHTLKKTEVFEDCACEALPQDLMLPLF